MSHPTHRTEISMDASSYDEICRICWATDSYFNYAALDAPCSASEEKRKAFDDKRKK